MIDAHIARRIVELMNEALALDPGAVNALCGQRVDCNEEIGDHESIQVLLGQENEMGDGLQVGLLGILNGIAGADDRDHWGAVSAIVDKESGAIERFEVLEDRLSLRDKPIKPERYNWDKS